MDLHFLDYQAIHGNTLFHRSSVLAKILLLTSVVIAILISQSLIALAVSGGFLLLLLISSGIRFKHILAFLLFPAIFTLLFAVTGFWGRWDIVGLLVVKSLSVVVAVLLLITTTSYPVVFSFFASILPSLVADGLFFTYRSFFHLLGHLQRILVILRLRGAISKRGRIHNLVLVGQGFGGLLLRSLDLAERQGKIMALRGVQSRTLQLDYRLQLVPADAVPLLATGIIIILAVML